MIVLIDGDPFISAACWDRGPTAAKAHIPRQIGWVVGDLVPTDYLIAVGDREDTNFRSLLYPGYKKSKSRIASKAKRPEWYDEVKEVLLAQPNVVMAKGCESDDLLRMWAYQAKAADEKFVVSSIDKDLDCIPGLHYDYKKKESYFVTEDEANKFYWQQILQGDSVDNIPGLPGIGPIRAKNILADTKTDAERRQKVIAEYVRVYGKDWKNWFLANGRLIHMWRHEHDYFN